MQKNALVIMFDSLQFNYIGAYGNEWIRTPNMDRLAREGAVFENCYIEGVPTVPCRRAMHTGCYTVHKAGWCALSMEDTTIADLCWGRPIDTALIYDCPMYRLPKFGYTRGFDKTFFIHGHEGDDDFYENDPLIHLDPHNYVEKRSYEAYGARYNSRKVGESVITELTNYLKQRQYWKGEKDRYVTRTVSKAIEYLENVDRNKAFFLWVDSFDPHEPWDPPSVYKIDENGNDDPSMRSIYDPDYQGKDEFLPCAELVEGIYDEAQLHHVRMLYAELITLCDKHLGRLMDAVRRLGFEENTLFWMVSDHGEPMGNGEHGHGLMRKVRPWPYEELVHAPSILRVPGTKPGQRIKAFTQSCDVAPTVCDWLGIGVHPAMTGKSLLPLVRGEVDKVRDFAIAGYYSYSWAIFTEDWSYIHWLKPDQDERIMRMDFYRSNVDGSHLAAVGGKASTMPELTNAMKAALDINDSAKRYQENVSVDGADQWTCTPGSSSQVPEKDELYDRRADPFQLHNIIDQHPDKAMELFDMLRGCMTELHMS